MREEFRGEKQNLYMGDRRTEVNHPASGKTSFTYNPLGNVLTKQTANMAEEGKMITYTYDYHRLTGINYPDHPENNVKYYYGGIHSSNNRIGRLLASRTLHTQQHTLNDEYEKTTIITGAHSVDDKHRSPRTVHHR